MLVGREMELLSGLSARTLQYAFRSKFGVTPTQWQRRERMLLAQRLLCDNPNVSITQLAHDMGLSSVAAFSTLYKRHFGEPPSRVRVTRAG